MNDQMNHSWATWKIQNMDDEHYYRMGSWPKEKRPGLFNRIWQLIKNEAVVVACRLETLNHTPYLTMAERCECTEG